MLDSTPIVDILPTMHGAHTGRSSSIDVRFGTVDNLEGQTGGKSLQQAFEKLSRRNKSITSPLLASLHSPKYEKAELVWREVDTSSRTGRWRTRKTLIYTGIFLSLVCFAWSQDLLNTPASAIFGQRSSGENCNPFAVPGKFHVDYSEPSNNFWETNDASCTAPRYISQLRSGSYEGLDWMRNRTVLLIGDSIERDHVNLFASIMGQEAEIVKGHHPLALASDSAEAAKVTASMKKKDRYGRIAYKGMQESTLPRVVHIQDLDFMMINLYHFGLDQEHFWQNLDQYRGPNSIEERFQAEVLPLVAKLQKEGRDVDMVEIGTGMFDLARWAKQDMASSRSTEAALTKERLSWYQERVQKFADLTADAFPTAMKTWRGVTQAQDQALELDYFNDKFGHSPPSVTAYFAPARATQMYKEVRKLLTTFKPMPAITARSTKGKREQAVDPQRTVHYNPWSTLLDGVPAHQLDRLHGGDIATPGAVLWSDIMLWHLRQATKSQQPEKMSYRW